MPAVMSLLLLVALPSCGGGSDDETGDDSDRLYHETVRLAHIYADSIRNAPDSAAAMGAFAHFQEKLDTLNFSVKADTDLLLTEGENDTIFLNLQAIRKIYDNKLKALMHNHSEAGAEEAPEDE